MSSYDVYAIGNALVDIEYEVSSEELDELGIDKGTMTLVNETQQARIVERIGSHEMGRGSGGSAANTVIAVSQLGGKAYYSCRVANDEFGSFYLRDLKRAGVATRVEIEPRVDGVTGKCLVLVTPDAERTMNTFLGVSADVSPDDVDPRAIGQSQYAYVEGYLVTSPSSMRAALYAIEQARSSTVKTAFTLSDRNIVQYFRPEIDQLIGDGIDLLFANDEEAKCLADSNHLDGALEYLKSIAGQFVVTCGGDGAVAYDGHAFHDIAAVKTVAIDTLGAGDMFAGAFLYGITHRMDFAQAGRLASLAAAKIVSHRGPRLKMEDMHEVLKKFPG
jgi:sugar/nucleoside kinase (ribokinase family)